MKSQKAAIGISAILLSIFCGYSSSAQDSIPFENSLKEANVTVTTMQDPYAPIERRLELTTMELKCEYAVNPLGIDVVEPRLSWVLGSGVRGQKQTAYQVLVATSMDKLTKDNGDLWNSGKVKSDQTIHVVYAGKSLTSRMRCYWKVRVWDINGESTSWSKPAMWSMGLLESTDWQAQWISDPSTNVETSKEKTLHNGYHSALVHSSDVEKWVAVDLGKAYEIDSVQLFPSQPFDWKKQPGFMFPLRFVIESAGKEDFSDARILVDHSRQDVANPGLEAQRYRFPAVTTRYVRLRVTRLRLRNKGSYGLALAEMEVFSGDKNLAKDKKVMALDSYEYTGWSKSRLVDGRQAEFYPYPEWALKPATQLRKSFHVGGNVKRATAYVTGLGLYEMRLNGRRVGDHILAPEYTAYGERIQYQTFDVTGLLVSGDNAVGAILGDGWHGSRFFRAPPPWTRPFQGQRGFIMRLDIESTDGKTQTLVTDKSWRCTGDGPIRSASIYDGQVYDARKETPGWDTPGFDDSEWQSVSIADYLSGAKTVWQRNEPIRVTNELTPVEITEPKAGTYVFDVGQNMVGWCRFKVRGPAGTTVTMRHAEMLNDDGTIYTASLRGAKQTEVYTKRSDGEEIYEPHFTYHGFRYVELTGLSQKPELDDVLGRAFHSDATDTGSFECSSELINQIMHMIFWVQRGNMHSIPTDCPQRNERGGWLGDIQSFSQTSIFNKDMAAFFSKWALDIRDSQADDGRFPNFAPMPRNSIQCGTPAWGDGGTIVPWRMYQNYADTRMIEEHFDAARRWVDYVRSKNPNMRWEIALGNNFNDWLNADTLKVNDWPKTGGAVPNHVLATAFFAHSTEIVAKMAAVIDRRDDANKYGQMFEDIKAAFNEKYVDADGRIEGDTQAGYALALRFNLLPDELRPKAAKHMVDGFQRYNDHMSTGIQTSHRLMLELSRNGYNDQAYRLLNLRSFPSWGFMIDQGATTVWERWDGYVKGRGFQNPSMNSFNHYALGSVGEWIWRNIAGINPDEKNPGYKHFTLRPRHGGGLKWAKATYKSIRGPITSEWKIADNKFTLNIAIPPNTTATVYVPATDAKSVTESGKPADKANAVTFLHIEDGRALFRVGSGKYSFVSTQF